MCYGYSKFGIIGRTWTMGKINDKNLQYRLAFQDEDLKKPTHDIIMHWLDNWAKNKENISRFFKDNRTRTKNTYHSFNTLSSDLIDQSPYKSSIVQQFETEFKSEYSAAEKHDVTNLLCQ
jgi:hypothetical protein